MLRVHLVEMQKKPSNIIFLVYNIHLKFKPYLGVG